MCEMWLNPIRGTCSDDAEERIGTESELFRKFRFSAQKREADPERHSWLRGQPFLFPFSTS